MSRIFEALQHGNPELIRTSDPEGEIPQNFSSLVSALGGESANLEETKVFRISESPTDRLVAWIEPNCLASENFRMLSARLRHARQRRPLKKVLVTSAVRGDGKSVVSANLAIALATHGERTLLLEGDLHRPSLSATFSVDGSRGFATWHEEPLALSSLLYRADGLPLWFLPAGECRQQPLTLIQSAKTSELLERLSNTFSWIVVDSPPLLSLADSGIWATTCDAVILLARHRLTPKNALLDSVQSIDASKLFALVMNDAESNVENYYNSYHSPNTGKKKVVGNARD
jgi:protein-tyrosine kinase